MIDVKSITALRDSAQSGVDFKKVFWNLKKGEKATVRLVASKYTPKNPFTEVNRHAWNVAKGALVLTAFGEKDPIIEYYEKNKKDWEYAKKFKPVKSFTVPVIVRGEEEKGVRLWTISTSILSSLVELFQDPDYGDITDVKTGRDLKLTKTTETFPKTSIIAGGKPTPLSTDENQVKLWLEKQPETFKCFNRCTYGELKVKLEDYLNATTSDAGSDGKVSTEAIDNLFK